MNEPKPFDLATLTPLQVQLLKRRAAGLATKAERAAIRRDERAARPRGLRALKSGKARL